MANSLKKSFDRSLVEGPILKSVWKLAWPTMLQNVIAGLQGIIDHTLVDKILLDQRFREPIGRVTQFMRLARRMNLARSMPIG